MTNQIITFEQVTLMCNQIRESLLNYYIETGSVLAMTSMKIFRPDYVLKVLSLDDLVSQFNKIVNQEGVTK